MLKRRDRTIIRAACYHLLKLAESFVFPIEKIKDCLLACAMLNIREKNFLERLSRDAFEQIKQINDPFIVSFFLLLKPNERFKRTSKTLLEVPNDKRLCFSASIDYNIDGNTSFTSL